MWARRLDGIRPWVQRALSWPIALVAVAALVMVAVLSVHSADGAFRSNLADQQTLSAKLVITLTVDANVTESVWEHGVLEEGRRAALDHDVDILRARGELIGLEMWDRQGRLLYADAGHLPSEQRLPPAELARALENKPFVQPHESEGNRGVPFVEVFRLADPAVDGSFDGIVEVLLPSGEVDQAVRSNVMRVRAAASLVVCIIVALLVGLRRRLRRQLRDAERDPLTGLANRVRLYRLADAGSGRAVERATTSLLLIDLDGFKRVNDAFGHVVGDEVLVEVGRRLRSAVANDPSLVRLGGDEFALLVQASEDDIGAASTAAARTIIDVLIDPVTVGPIAVQIGASIGYAIREANMPVEELLRRADIAMYRAKRTRSGHEEYTVDRDDSDADGVALLGDVSGAIARGEFFLEYQPKVDRIGQLVGVEALVRWEHPTRGILQPSCFIPLIEETALMKPLTIEILNHATAEASSWRRAGLGIPVSVNVSPSTLLDDEFLPLVDRALRASGLPPSSLTIELTETAVVAEPARAQAVVSALRAKRIRVAVDDFGVGFTSLKYLGSIEFSELKLDKTFVDALDDGGSGIAIAANTINLAHDLGMYVTAEGVETDLACQMLTEMGCDEFQGYLFAEPMRPDEIAPWTAGRIGVVVRG